ncbi:MAG: TonB-dependent receptor [Dysgonamonadaceae bacterium]|jgi:TonB-linked SusC/RagA family outer membrane protein|nr:TonB-dependent receptor [Dysgonamonadaceae bacterium]
MSKKFKKSIKLLFVMAACSFAFESYAQTAKTVEGLVTDANGSPLIGVTVTVKGTQRATITDANGVFALKASDGEELSLTYLGYTDVTKRIVANTSHYNITMEEKTYVMDDVVVVGYGTQKRINLTGAVGAIDARQIEKRLVNSSSAVLQGLVPGVTVTTQSGAPGGDGGQINIRGISSFGSSDNSPLVIIDGIEGSLDHIDPGLIENISILKDAASSAIYGLRAANGVILVTTKRGSSKEKFSLTYKGYAGFQTPVDMPELVNSVDYMKLYNVAYENDGNYASKYSDATIEAWARNAATDPDHYPDVDWQKVILDGSGMLHNHFLTMGASSGNINMLTSLGYMDQEGIIKNTDFKRYTFRNNMDIKFTDKFSMKLDLQFVNRDRLQSPYESTVFNYINRTPPNLQYLYSNGLYGEGWNGNNPVALINDGGNKTTSYLSMTGAITLQYKLLKWLSVEGMAAPKYNTQHVHTYKKVVNVYDVNGNLSSYRNLEKNELTETESRSVYGNWQFLLKTDNKFGGHSLKTLLGTSRESYDNKTLRGFRKGWDFPEYEVLDAGSPDETQESGGTHQQWLLVSAFGRINYDYKSRYLFEMNLRYDGTSRFARGQRFQAFPSVSAGWRVTEEPFMHPVKNVLDNLKIRASWGQLGNQNIGQLNPYTQSLATGAISMDDKIYNIVTINKMANPDITWEVSTMTDVGIDLTLFRKFSITSDFYHKMTDGIILVPNIPSITGYAKSNAPTQNGGKVRNVGWELGIGYQDKIGEVDLGINANLSDVENKIVSFKATETTDVLQSREGYPINSIYGYVADGYFQNQQEIDDHIPQFGAQLHPGDIRYVDQTGDNQITADDMVIIGSTIPRYTYGFNLDLGWKGIQFNMFLQGVGKADGLLNSHYIIPCQMGTTFKEQHKDYWRPDNPDATFPRFSITGNNNAMNSTHWMRSTAYMRLKNIQIGYQLPKKWTQKIGIKSALIYTNAQNLFTLKKFWEGYDVEVAYDPDATDGVTLGSANVYPQVTTYTFGIELKF